MPVVFINIQGINPKKYDSTYHMALQELTMQYQWRKTRINFNPIMDT